MSRFLLFGEDSFDDVVTDKDVGALRRLYGVPPFSIVSAFTSHWMERKNYWLSKGIRGELGRTGLGDTCFSSSTDYAGKEIGKDAGSVFDPFLCELMYNWFCPVGGQIIDPFAGGSVRGVVAGFCDRNYWGCDLREEQVIANREQAKTVKPTIMPVWVCGDSIVTMSEAPEADFLFSCPPYADLEKYSDDPKDISNMNYEEFLIAYNKIITKSLRKLKQNSFAVFVVGEIRDKKTGMLRNFVGDTISAFVNSGAGFYNKGVIQTPIGTARLRTKQFKISRKLVNINQYFLVFCKGDPKKAAEKNPIG